MIKRRDFMRNLLTLSAGAAAASVYDGNPFKPRMRFAHAQTGTKTLVVVFQRGGVDGLSMCVPHGLQEYYDIRSSIAIPAPGGGAGSALDLDGFFGLNPALSGLMGPWNAGSLAVFPACHYEGATRSHFDGQQNLESGEDDERGDGWLNRYLTQFPRQAQVRAIGLEGGLPHALRGQEIVSNFSNLTNFDLDLDATTQAELLADIQPVYAQLPDATRLTRELVARTGQVTLNDLGVLAPYVNQSYSPENGAMYPDTTFGRQLTQTAQMIKADVGLEICTLSIGGWDTHSNQGNGGGGRLASRLQELSDGLGALNQDMGGRMQDVIVCTMSEFGRTSVQNGSNGTDHAHATTWFAFGGAIQGGFVYPDPGNAAASYPGNPNNGGLQDVRGRYLRHNIDFRNVMGEILSRHLGATDVSSIVGGSDGNGGSFNFQPIGFIA